MSPVVKKKRKKITITSQQLLLVLTAVCAFLLIFTFNTNVFEGVLKQAAGYVVVPFQNGIATIGGYLSDRSDELAQLKDVLALNKDLQEQIDQLTIENNQLQQDRYELNNLRSLYDLDQAYSDYDKIGARVISSETDNWFSSFTINKGEEEGVQVDYNVMAGSGLVGRVVSVGPHYAKVISIISDTSSVSATVLATSNNLIVSGSLQSVQSDGTILFSQLSDPDKLDLSRAFLSHSGGGISEETLQAMKKEILRCAPFQEVQIIRAGCTISAHCGPKTATVMFMEK